MVARAFIGFPTLLSFAILLSFAGGCANKRSAIPDASTHPVADSSHTALPTNIARAEKLIDKALVQKGWALLSKTNEITALRVEALTPSAQDVVVTAQLDSSGAAQIQVRVGYFGDPEKEKQFIGLLNKLYADETKEHRGRRKS